MFKSKNRKNVYPGKPQFSYVKVGCMGVFITRTCFHDGAIRTNVLPSKPKWAATYENQQCGFWPGLTQTRLYSHWGRLGAWNFVFRKKRYFTFQVAKTKALISFTAKLICVFVFIYAKRWFSHDAAQMKKKYKDVIKRDSEVIKLWPE